MTGLNSSFCQFIKYQDAHVNLLTKRTDFILNSVCNFTTFWKELHIGSTFPSVLLVYIYICCFSPGLNIGFKF